MTLRDASLFALVAVLLVVTGMVQSWNLALQVLNMGLISAIMALGVNLQWGFAGLFNVGVMGFVALGGLAVALTAMPPVAEAWQAGGTGIVAAMITALVTIAAAVQVWRRRLPRRGWLVAAILVAGFMLYRYFFDPARDAIEDVNPALQGNLGGLGLPVLMAWPLGGVLAAGAAWLIGKTALGLRSDYLAIATLGIAEIILAVMKNEDWLARGVKNVIGIPSPLPSAIELQESAGFAAQFADPVTASTVTVKLGYALLFAAVLIVLLILMQLALRSPWGRMVRAIRDNEVAAEAMGKDVTRRHLQIFVLGSAICGLAGAMMTTLDGQLVPSTYQPLRFTFLIWVMVIVGGSGNNFGAVLGGMLIWFLWVQVEPVGQWLVGLLTSGLPEGAFRDHLLNSAAYMRLFTMGVLMLVVLRFSPRGLIPER
ncbi:branched-chain amino acid ABC transporter, permease protein [Pseudooceanicola batsensis HTCC2597]|uniref:Branched-chain amino acid ABC transporter, permease protein n=1 Tax=Pseudooceanicola batsensis (strain ATCC BAA-863 / DSM 15984 / KCTC 12145 / HTCC2597) TaxID=252305 RepID=A3TX90_PSEBH|nr:branched-chain amino acid ABC transporter permease [Pseudooceanicola batsensis]EAQ03450.1 branched-chain amino acid ABC transporter, permease protein [Pseudooceanicola batsensis HTCC2597]